MASNGITARRSFHRIWIPEKKSLVKRAPDTKAMWYTDLLLSVNIKRFCNILICNLPSEYHKTIDNTDSSANNKTIYISSQDAALLTKIWGLIQYKDAILPV